jgi:glutamate dehydrogenase
MSTGTQAVESELIESVCERVRERVAPGEVQEAEAFVRAYYKGAPAEDLQGREPVDLYGAALSHWTFGRGRPERSALVRVYNPTFEQHGWQSPHTAIDVVSDDMPFLVDSVSMELSRREAGIHAVIGDESYMHIEIDRQASGFEELADALQHVLAQVRAAVEDWRPMKARLQELIDEPAPAPARARAGARRPAPRSRSPGGRSRCACRTRRR